MKQMIQLWKAEHLKSRRTAYTWVHLCVPVAISFFFLWYYSFSSWDLEAKLEAFIQVLSIGFPFMISIVVSLAVDQERKNNFAVLLAGTPNKYAILVVKIARLICWGALSLVLSFLIFGLGMHYLHSPLSGIVNFLVLAAIMMVSVLVIYVVHWFVDSRFSRNYSIALGLIESLIAAVFLTGLGDGIWMFVASSWPVRYTSYYMVYTRLEDLAALELTRSILINNSIIDGVIALLLLIAFFLWFKNWEGKSLND